MIRVTIGTNTNRKSITVDPSRTLKDVLDENGIDYSTGGIHLDGLAVGGEGLNKSFAAHGITEDCILIAVVKGDGGVM
ncbi:MAG: hypothetical protein J6Y02_15250 [Pseudobutyrivibrio sp.]|nr:hypothetical protein [Pseudobutyrivibrio sp.]